MANMVKLSSFYCMQDNLFISECGKIATACKGLYFCKGYFFQVHFVCFYRSMHLQLSTLALWQDIL